jgi:hypothetical protein
LSQHFVGTEEIIGQSVSFVREERRSVVFDKGVDGKGISLGEIGSSESLENKH